MSRVISPDEDKHETSFEVQELPDGRWQVIVKNIYTCKNGREACNKLERFLSDRDDRNEDWYKYTR